MRERISRQDTDLVVYNRAIQKDNPEILAAKKLHIKTLPYAEVLGKIDGRIRDDRDHGLARQKHDDGACGARA